MSIKVKSGGAYADIVGAFVKQGGVYSAASVFAKVAGAYQAVGGGGAGTPANALRVDEQPLLVDSFPILFS